MIELAGWTSAWKTLGVPEPAGLGAELVSRYREPQRVYHTLRHLGECFAALDPAQHLASRLPEVTLALWFHDAVYDTRASDNEEMSARLARERLLDAGLTVDPVTRVHDLILATKHQAVPADGDARLVEDVDLAILAAPAERFWEFERQIREEYAWVPEPVFNSRRAAIMKNLLERPCIYGTPYFRRRSEKRARLNLTESLRRLSR